MHLAKERWQQLDGHPYMAPLHPKVLWAVEAPTHLIEQ